MQRSNTVDLILMSTRVNRASSPPPPLIILSCPVIVMYGIADPGHRAICSPSIDAEIIRVGQEGNGDTHVWWPIWSRLPRLASTPGRPARSDGGGKMKGDAVRFAAKTDLNQSPPPPHPGPYLHYHLPVHHTLHPLPLFLHLHLRPPGGGLAYGNR